MYYDTPEVGSSPLARGLLPLWALAIILLGIIPARAGFTSGSSGWCWRASDHPRSRGVYALDYGDEAGADGSSPLARGLPAKPQAVARRIRIIPARAGFTGDPGVTEWAAEDHPRSRGVYCSWHARQ